MNVTVWRGDSAELPAHRQRSSGPSGLRPSKGLFRIRESGLELLLLSWLETAEKRFGSLAASGCSGSAGGVFRARQALRSKARSPVLLPGQPSPAPRLPQLLADAFQLLRKPAALPRGGPLL